MSNMDSCLLCDQARSDAEFQRVEAWRDGVWRLTMSLVAPVLGFAYLEPQRHIPYITDLDGPEAETLGSTLARVTAVIKQESGAELVYVNVFGERVAHLHFNIAPHRPHDPLRGGPGMVHEDAFPLPEADLRSVINRVEDRLADASRVSPEEPGKT
jgi:diadenosine tetraphosphate (Ap4A) HIT family hydrolase